MIDNLLGRSDSGPKLFGTFGGVFTPTILTILGVIMYLRLPWTVGNAGLLGGIAIILLANGITVATGLSLSSIATNTRLGAGGPYAIVSRSLGFEIGRRGPDLDFVHEMVEATRSSCMFAADSGLESALA